MQFSASISCICDYASHFRMINLQRCETAAQEAHALEVGQVEISAEGVAKGLSIRGVARELGIRRDTAKKYMNAQKPPTSPGRLASAAL